MATIIIVFAILIIAFLLSVPHLPRRVEPAGYHIQKAGTASDDKARIIRDAYYANERAHRTNHADFCQTLEELAYLRRSPINYGPATPQLQSGDYVDAEVNDIAGLLSAHEEK